MLKRGKDMLAKQVLHGNSPALETAERLALTLTNTSPSSDSIMCAKISSSGALSGSVKERRRSAGVGRTASGSRGSIDQTELLYRRGSAGRSKWKSDKDGDELCNGEGVSMRWS